MTSFRYGRLLFAQLRESGRPYFLVEVEFSSAALFRARVNTHLVNLGCSAGPMSVE